MRSRARRVLADATENHLGFGGLRVQEIPPHAVDRERREYADDRNDDHQLDQGETARFS
jgi:hypothetical protein